jgi:crotonobetainyl-CoA:carnitine CoA-transferase CaiB-like acyl-CoA transferase
MRLLQSLGIAAGIVADAHDLFTADEQLDDRGFWTSCDHPLFGERPHDRFPARFAGDPVEDYRPSPYFGEHNFEVLEELLGWDAARVAEAMADDLVR